MYPHHHQISMTPLTMSSPVKGFSLYVESEDVAVAIAELEMPYHSSKAEIRYSKKMARWLVTSEQVIAILTVLIVPRKVLIGMQEIKQGLVHR